MRTFCKANAPAESVSRQLAAPAKRSASAFALDEFSVVSMQFSVRRKKRRWSKLKKQRPGDRLSKQSSYSYLSFLQKTENCNGEAAIFRCKEKRKESFSSLTEN